MCQIGAYPERNRSDIIFRFEIGHNTVTLMFAHSGLGFCISQVHPKPADKKTPSEAWV